jgi:chromosomal replication initiation ATPase DnaA
MSLTRQLPLPLPHSQAFLETDFLRFPSNEAAWAWLGRSAEWPGGQLALFGEPGCGKTHLLHIWARRHGAVHLFGPALPRFPDLPAAGGIVLDDADETGDKLALLHLLNAAAEAGLKLLIAGREPPARWPVRLPDLASRLRAITAIRIDPPEDALLAALLARLLAERQFAVPAAVQAYLVTRLPRTHAALADAARRLDVAGLALGGPITHRVADQVIAEIAAAAVDGDGDGDGDAGAEPDWVPAAPPDEFPGSAWRRSPGGRSLV